MSFHLALQHKPIPQSPASSSLTSLDDEADNTVARVYFGPIQTPERALIAEATHKRNSLTTIPVRRSPRISALQSQNLEPQPSPLREEGKAVEATSGEQQELKISPPSTPSAPDEDEDNSQDDLDLEPTSALATKISRAHDNPSPPPQMQPLEQESVNPSLLIPTEQNPPSDSAVSQASGSAIVDGPSPRAQTPTPRTGFHKSPASLDNKQRTIPANTSTDLIVFDDDNLLGVPKVEPAVEPFPDLLAPTPSRNRGPFLIGLESTFQTTLSSTQISSHGNEELEQNCALPLKTIAIPSNPPTTGSPAPLRRSPRLSQSDSPSLRPTQSALVPRNVDPPDTHSSQGTRDSPETTGDDVVVGPPRPVRELGSLSPVSEGVLHNLLSTTEATTTTSIDQIPALASVLPTDQLSHDPPSIPEHQPLPEQQSHPVVIQVQRPPEWSPWRSHIANAGSPSKSGFNSTLHDPNRTPARRIPISEAIAQGSASPRKDGSSGPSSGIFGRPVFSRYTQEDWTRSPVRRPPDVANHTTVTQSGIPKPTTPTSPGKVRCGSEEPQVLRRSHPGRPFQRSASDSEISSPSKERRIPTFTMRTAIDARLPSTIPEEHREDSPMKATQPSPSAKSALRQPSSMAASRIPRIGVKPYARPPEKQRQQEKGKEPVHRLFMAKRPTSSSVPTKPVRLVRSISAAGSGSSSEEPADSRAMTPGVPLSSQTSISTLPQPSPSLKRKRTVEEMSSPPATQPTFARLVTSVARQKPMHGPPAQPPDLGPVVKKTRVGHVRTVGGDPATQKHAARSPGTQASVDETAKAGELPETCPVSSPGPHIAPLAPSPTPPPALPSAPEQPTPPGVQTEPTVPLDIQQTTSPSELDTNSSNRPPDSLSLSVTRITRSRRNPQLASDVFGPVRPLQRRRRAAETSGEGTFSSMSALALKALTTTNTTKNQHNLVAVLEKEIIRKPGNRPESPTTRVKTIEEKRKLEQEQGRRERAERRARRSSEPREDSSLTSDDEESLPLGPDGRPTRHRLGPGDEEDYETPERIGRSGKRARIHETEEPGEEVAAKSVRWDRGLFTTIYFDDLPLQSHASEKPQAPGTSTRGALAGSAKALRLDSLGNLVDATSPLKNLVQENVVIKKYVYDDDAEAAEVDAPNPLPAKGKGKKTKS